MTLDRKDQPLLAAKLTIPQSYDRMVVPRLHLYYKLDDAADYPLGLISAPAGFGKTTLLREWLRQQGRRPLFSAWLALEYNDNDLQRFWSYFIAALGNLNLSISAIFRSLSHSSSEEMWIMLINALAELSVDIVLVLDDYHMITDEAIHRYVAFLLEHCPPRFHLVISSRTDPPLPLTQMRVQGRVKELRMADLRFTLDETMTFFHQMKGLSLPVETIQSLHSNTEGWIAALQLAALSLQDHHASSANIILSSSCLGIDRYIVNYFVEEVLTGLAEHVQTFLLTTSILQRMNADLCNLVTERTDSEAMLEWLHQSNLFISSADTANGWYRYHRLFGHFLRSRAQQTHPDLLPLLHLRASTWYEEHDLPIDATDHAIAASAFERVGLLVERHASSLLRQGQVGLVYTWLKQLQERGIAVTHPLVTYLYACRYLYTGQLAAYEQSLEQAEECWRECGQVEMLSKINHLHAYIALLHDDGTLAMIYARQALELAPVRSSLAGISQVLLGAGYLSCGDILQAHVALLHGQRNCQSERDAVLPSIAVFYLGDLYLYQGRLQEAMSYYRYATQRFDEYMPWYPIMAHCRLGEVYCELNDASSANEHLQRAMQLADAIDTHWILPWVSLLAARIVWLHSEKEQAFQWLDKAEHDAQCLGELHVILAYALALRIQYLLTDGNVDAAHYWWERYDHSLFFDKIKPSLFAGDMWSLARARMLIAQELPEEALTVLEDRRSLAQKQGRVHSEMAMLVLQARAYNMAGDVRCGKQMLERALFLGEPSTYRRVFINEGNAIASLLLRIYDRQKKYHKQWQSNSTFAYMCSLLTGFGYNIDLADCNGNSAHKRINGPLLSAIPVVRQMIDPLSEREQEVLRLIAEGHSNQQIAQTLIVAESTIKTHLNNIYAKLNVNSRLQALTRAYAYGLLEQH
jgi:LuxR family transcriptional regulator, maltose regulon positive regulatory protein